jgi:Na+/glutamate symporter
MEWFFDGLGTAIITLIIGLISGGTVGYRIGIKKNKTVQKQKAKDNANQTQIGGDFYGR